MKNSVYDSGRQIKTLEIFLKTENPSIIHSINNILLIYFFCLGIFVDYNSFTEHLQILQL